MRDEAYYRSKLETTALEVDQISKWLVRHRHDADPPQVAVEYVEFLLREVERLTLMTRETLAARLTDAVLAKVATESDYVFVSGFTPDAMRRVLLDALTPSPDPPMTPDRGRWGEHRT